MRKILKISLLFIIALDLLALGIVGFFTYKASVPLNNFSGEFREVTIESGSGLDEIALEFKKKGVISNTSTFVFYAILENKENNLKAGTYTITPSMSVKDIVNIIAKGSNSDIAVVTFPEGFTSAQMAQRLEEKEVLSSEDDFLNIVKLSTSSASELVNYDFLKSVSADSLEGFLFPDTFEFEIDTDPVTVVNKILAAFNDKAWPLVKNGYNGQYGELDSYEVLVLASLLEEEVQTEEDMKMVSGILFNRMEIGMPLQVDATLAYITGKQTGEITNKDKEIDSPYNTYQNSGLPPAPISNPGLKAIRSALDPTENDYFYYLTGKDGTTHYGKTLEEHNINKQLYLR
ncbi:MAG: endolytic transglycosylase MltG [Candidatus Spechtbacterales bacterium]|nr:endolytic transglycosylase MltG [Candidatus Spechtbacterales bacterium]